MITPGMFSSQTDMWETPQDLFDELDREFGFTLDVCAVKSNAKCPRFFSPLEDGLAQTWEGVCWCNPPYGRKIGKWVQKAFESARRGATVVMLVPARTDTAWWHDYIQGYAEIRFLRGRLKFGGGANSAPFPSAIAVFARKGDLWIGVQHVALKQTLRRTMPWSVPSAIGRNGTTTNQAVAIEQMNSTVIRLMPG
jgi:phage N-6-adenine-methyltransferase